MTSVRKRKMARSSIRKNTKRVKDKQRTVNILSNPFIAAKWDKTLTLAQNYKNLGLRSRLSTRAGGEEQHAETLTEIRTRRDLEEPKKAAHVTPSDIENTEDPAQIPEGEARIVRDPETGAALRVVYGTKKAVVKEVVAPVEDSVVADLERTAKKHAELNSKKERHQSAREKVWCRELYEKHGDDYEAMKWDKKANPTQLSAGTLKRTISKWKRDNGIN